MHVHGLLDRMGSAITAVAIVIGAGGVVAAQESTSRPLAQRVVQAMTTQKLTAWAAPLPDHPDTFVAALLFPGVQLLVVVGRPLAPSVAAAQLAARDYAGLYATLHQAVAPETKLFVQDMLADGLTAKTPGSADIVYEHVTRQFIFDGAPAKRNVSDEVYRQQFATQDEHYRELLKALLDRLGLESTTSS